MGDVIKLLAALAPYAWPAVAFAVFMCLRGALCELLSRVRHAKFPGGEIELAELAKTLHADVTEVADATPPLASGSDSPRVREVEGGERSTLPPGGAIGDPRLALMDLSSELERATRRLVACLGFSGEIESNSLRGLMAPFVRRRVVDPNLVEALREFSEVRNRVVHGMSAESGSVLSALDSGRLLLKTIRSVPHEINTIAGLVPIYEDETCSRPTVGAKGLLLNVVSSEGESRGQRIFPTTGTYTPGLRVSWEWNRGRVFGKSWYRDPKSGVVKLGWDSALEFVGKPVE